MGGRLKRKAAAVCSGLWQPMGRSRIPYGNPWSWEVLLAFLQAVCTPLTGPSDFFFNTVQILNTLDAVKTRKCQGSLAHPQALGSPLNPAHP